MCMKEDNPDTNIKGDNSREITDCAGQGISFVIQLKLWLKPDIIKQKNNNNTHFHFKSSSNHFASEIFMTVYKILPSEHFFSCCVI